MKPCPTPTPTPSLATSQICLTNARPQFEFLRQLSSDPNNTVVGLVRDPAGTKQKVAAELPDRSNIHILAGDLTDYDSLKSAAAETSAITGGSLDYLIANAALMTAVDGFCGIGDMSVLPCRPRPKYQN